jgi:hypothetical protein
MKAAVEGPQTEEPGPRIPMVGSLPVCCARAASGRAVEPTTPLMKSRRRIAAPKAQGLCGPCFGTPQLQQDLPRAKWGPPFILRRIQVYTFQRTIARADFMLASLPSITSVRWTISPSTTAVLFTVTRLAWRMPLT